MLLPRVYFGSSEQRDQIAHQDGAGDECFHKQLPYELSQTALSRESASQPVGVKMQLSTKGGYGLNEFRYYNHNMFNN